MLVTNYGVLPQSVLSHDAHLLIGSNVTTVPHGTTKYIVCVHIRPTRANNIPTYSCPRCRQTRWKNRKELEWATVSSTSEKFNSISSRGQLVTNLHVFDQWSATG